MKLLIIEPLGVEKEKLLGLAQEKLGGKVEIVYNDTRVTDTKTLVERAKDADILAFSNLPFKKEVLENCPDLKMISVAFTGVDHVAMDYCRERGILVSNCAGYSNTAVPELVFGMVLCLYRSIVACNQAVREGKDKTGLIGLELEGKKFGIIGMGAIGTRTAQLAAAFGCQVYGYNRSPKSPETVFLHLGFHIKRLHDIGNVDALCLTVGAQHFLPLYDVFFLEFVLEPLVDFVFGLCALNQIQPVTAGSF